MKATFNCDLYKCLLLVGDYGCGKTTLIRIFGEMYGTLFQKNVTFMSSIEIVDNIRTHSLRAGQVA